MTTTNMFLNFGGKWDSPPTHTLEIFTLVHIEIMIIIIILLLL